MLQLISEFWETGKTGTALLIQGYNIIKGDETMNFINDPVFGQVCYRHGWSKNQEVSFWNKTMVLRITAAAYTDQGINDIQRQNYKDFIENINYYSEKSLEAVASYIEDNKQNIAMYLPKGKSITNVTDIVFPKAVVFSKDNSYGILCDCEWDIENGIVIQIPGFKVGPQDMFL